MNLIVISELFPPEETSTAYIMGGDYKNSFGQV